MTKEAILYNGEKTVSSTNDAGKTGQLHVKQNEIRTFINTYTKINSKWTKDLNVRLDIIKLLEENIGRTFSDINCSSVFLGQSPKGKRNKSKIK